MNTNEHPARRPSLAGCLFVCLSLFAAGLDAQDTAILTGRVVDERYGTMIGQAEVTLRAIGPRQPDLRLTWVTTTDAEGRYRFVRLPKGRYELTVDRPGYRSTPITVTLNRAESVMVWVLVDPIPFSLDSIVVALRDSRRAAPPWTAAGDDDGWTARTATELLRQQRFLASDVRQLRRAELLEVNTLVEGDVFRSLQQSSGVARRDDFTADLWTRGASAGQTPVFFDGVPLFGGLHGLGVLSGPNSDMLNTVTFHPGVMSASHQGGSAAVVELESRSPANGPRLQSTSLSPLSARVSADGRFSDRATWAVGARRSYVDLVSSAAENLTLGDGSLDYVFHDVTGRIDAVLSDRVSLETSGFFQGDRVFGDVAGVVPDNRGSWGASVARASLVTELGGATIRQTLGWSRYDASVREDPSSVGSSPLHPETENHYRVLMWEGSVGGADLRQPWSVGLRALRERHTYDGPGLDPTRMLSRDQIARYGLPDLTPFLLGLGSSRLGQVQEATRISLWGESRRRLRETLEVEAGVRVETGDRVQESTVRVAPRLLVRYRPDARSFSVSAAYGRAYQYTRSVATTDVVRSGLRASEILVHADSVTPPLRSDLVTIGAERWLGAEWLLGATLWLRESDGLLIPTPATGLVDGPSEMVSAVGSARGVELSVRKLGGAVRGFANYSLSGSTHSVDGRSFAAPEDQTHVGNLSVVADVRPGWNVGATLRVGSGVPFRRVILVVGGCVREQPCDEVPPVLLGNPAGQRGPIYAALNLETEWTRRFDRFSLTVSGQLRNVLGRENAVTYHSSCICASSGSSEGIGATDRFSRGLPRLPVLGVRVRF